jgi:hypothetical protein
MREDFLFEHALSSVKFFKVRIQAASSSLAGYLFQHSTQFHVCSFQVAALRIPVVGGYLRKYRLSLSHFGQVGIDVLSVRFPLGYRIPGILPFR